MFALSFFFQAPYDSGYSSLNMLQFANVLPKMQYPQLDIMQ